ncbi:diaminopropionate ammonia-lyase [Desertibaculum subflavum]|uniref:diaminopropionate ammonia-lyase n=1 Tax=Desertibaculum subflavum TaxID=2268458 RepID=UPI000E661F4B
MTGDATSKALRHARNAKAAAREAPPPKTLEAIGFVDAASAIRAWPGYAPTPLVQPPGLAEELRLEALYVKDEGQRLGLKSFKALGGAYAVQRLVATAKGPVTVTCATDGNHGRAVAWGARSFGAKAVIYMPEFVSPGRAAAIEALGAEVRRAPGNYDEIVRQVAIDAKQNGWHVVSDTSYAGYTDAPRQVMYGYGVMAEECIAAFKGEPPTHVLAQAGVGALAAALCARFWIEWGPRRPRFLTVEPETADCVFASIEEGKPATVTGDLATVMGGLSCGEVSKLAWEVLRTGVDDALAIGDSWAIDAMRMLARATPPVIAGETGGAGLGALIALAEAPNLKRHLDLTPDSRVLVINSEGDTDPAIYREIVGAS